ncbi:uncharacterized protein LOC119995659 [Tripterygium wilfordii]|uniref:uncharacterized protein LOC119995659 n=1 Tax=Tripterygium wilfordii TaxID=458696 RepID=UPI0018F80AEC|nr:uncharacterized protein LOC119995659 [Tripterygium wilfordii]
MHAFASQWKLVDTYEARATKSDSTPLLVYTCCRDYFAIDLLTQLRIASWVLLSLLCYSTPCRILASRSLAAGILYILGKNYEVFPACDLARIWPCLKMMITWESSMLPIRIVREEYLTKEEKLIRLGDPPDFIGSVLALDCNTGENNRVNNLNAEADAAGDDEDDVGVVTFPWFPLYGQLGYFALPRRDLQISSSNLSLVLSFFPWEFQQVLSTGWGGQCYGKGNRYTKPHKQLMDNRFQQHGQLLLKDQYYLVDSGYPCIAGYLPPFRGGRYHISEYHGRGRGPRTRKELFNYRHSSMRMVIERCFGVLKARFPILKLMPPYPPTRQRLIVVACCAIHNFLRQRTQQDHLFNTWENMDPSYMQPSTSTGARSSGASSSNNIANDQGAAIMSQYREHISNMMWIDHCNTSNDE